MVVNETAAHLLGSSSPPDVSNEQGGLVLARIDQCIGITERDCENDLHVVVRMNFPVTYL